MTYKYIHTMKFSCGSQIYTAKFESDTGSFTDALKRCKDKLFTPVGITVISFETEERKE